MASLSALAMIATQPCDARSGYPPRNFPEKINLQTCVCHLFISPTFSNSVVAPLKSILKQPKLAPSAWQLYFTDWIQRHQATSTRKLNVAQAAKEAGQEYASLTPEEKEVCSISLSSLRKLTCHSLTSDGLRSSKRLESARTLPT